ncbi:Transcription cofactor vestigial-like protein 1 [Heterocephalus glaber]|uniref:Transcription cofactor vestigial-like protein 1 n=1 Tax=Heterocephalus glaber TaxID=10181 RepID=G5ANA4_HETGA|nr:Transcription cofactor vestigial-like protein 1 [Heterocephalus glaber]
MKKTDTQLPTSRQKPIKTEWNSRSVLFTYFQGDISSEVDEHFSRALSNIKRPQELSPSSQSEEVILKNANTYSILHTSPEVTSAAVVGFSALSFLPLPSLASGD